MNTYRCPISTSIRKIMKNKYPTLSELLSQSDVSDNPIITFIEI